MKGLVVSCWSNAYKGVCLDGSEEGKESGHLLGALGSHIIWEQCPQCPSTSTKRHPTYLFVGTLGPQPQKIGSQGDRWPKLSQPDCLSTMEPRDTEVKSSSAEWWVSTLQGQSLWAPEVPRTALTPPCWVNSVFKSWETQYFYNQFLLGLKLFWIRFCYL